MSYVPGSGIRWEPLPAYCNACDRSFQYADDGDDWDGHEVRARRIFGRIDRLVCDECGLVLWVRP